MYLCFICIILYLYVLGGFGLLVRNPAKWKLACGRSLHNSPSFIAGLATNGFGQKERWLVSLEPRRQIWSLDDKSADLYLFPVPQSVTSLVIFQSPFISPYFIERPLAFIEHLSTSVLSFIRAPILAW